MSPEYVASQTLTPGLPPVPLAPLNLLPSPVTLSQVEDMVATSDLIWELHSHHLPSPSLSSSNFSSSFSMMVDDAEDSLPDRSYASSFDLWTESHLVPCLTASALDWETWLDNALVNNIPKVGLAEFIKTLSMTTTSPPAHAKFAWQQLKMLVHLISDCLNPPMPGA
jgi:hypothetical protein